MGGELGMAGRGVSRERRRSQSWSRGERCHARRPGEQPPSRAARERRQGGRSEVGVPIGGVGLEATNIYISRVNWWAGL